MTFCLDIDMLSRKTMIVLMFDRDRGAPVSRLPPHPDTDDQPSPATPDGPPGSRPLFRILVVTIMVLLVAGMVVLHPTGVVGPGSH